MQNHKLAKLHTIVLFACLFAGSICFASGKTRIKLATMAPEGSIWLNQIKELNKELAEITDNQISFKIYAGGIMGDDDVVIRKMRVGQLDGALFTTAALAKLNPELTALGFPGLFNSDDDVDKFLSDNNKIFNEYLQPEGYQVLAVMGLGFTYIFSKNPIQTIDDMKSAKGWLWGNDSIMKTMYEQLGITPVSLGISDVMTALQTGLVNTVFNTPTGVLSMQWFTRVDQMLDVPLTQAFGSVILSRRSWDKISDDLKPVVAKAIQKHAAEITRKTRIEDSKSLAILMERGVHLQKASPEFLEQEKVLIQNSINKLLDSGIGKNLYNTIKAESASQK